MIKRTRRAILSTLATVALGMIGGCLGSDDDDDERSANDPTATRRGDSTPTGNGDPETAPTASNTPSPTATEKPLITMEDVKAILRPRRELPAVVTFRGTVNFERLNLDDAVVTQEEYRAGLRTPSDVSIVTNRMVALGYGDDAMKSVSTSITIEEWDDRTHERRRDVFDESEAFVEIRDHAYPATKEINERPRLEIPPDRPVEVGVNPEHGFVLLSLPVANTGGNYVFEVSVIPPERDTATVRGTQQLGSDGPETVRFGMEEVWPSALGAEETRTQFAASTIRVSVSGETRIEHTCESPEQIEIRNRDLYGCSFTVE